MRAFSYLNLLTSYMQILAPQLKREELIIQRPSNPSGHWPIVHDGIRVLRAHVLLYTAHLVIFVCFCVTSAELLCGSAVIVFHTRHAVNKGRTVSDNVYRGHQFQSYDMYVCCAMHSAWCIQLDSEAERATITRGKRLGSMVSNNVMARMFKVPNVL